MPSSGAGLSYSMAYFLRSYWSGVLSFALVMPQSWHS
jgi:hypothetical protein